MLQQLNAGDVTRPVSYSIVLNFQKLKIKFAVNPMLIFYAEYVNNSYQWRSPFVTAKVRMRKKEEIFLYAGNFPIRIITHYDVL